jgi:formylglycine-generating enzyme required for sulfatase activity
MGSVLLILGFSALLLAGEGVPYGVQGSTAPAAAAVKPALRASAARPEAETMALIPAGQFLMGSPEGEGSPNERPAHEVSLEAYLMDRYEVAAAQYKIFADATGRKLIKPVPAGQENFPAVRVNWYDAQAYCGYYGKRLPTEAEWEYAARAGAGGKYSFGDDAGRLGEYAWFWGNSNKQLHPVGRKKPNQYGLYDMHGNALEWVADWYDAGYYELSTAKNPEGSAGGGEKSVRGGSAFVSADLCRSAARMRSTPDTAYSGRGFRCAVSLPKLPAGKQ